MPSLRRLPRTSVLALTLAVVLVVACVLVWFVPYLTRKEQWPAGVPDPPALLSVTEFAVPPGGQACVGDVTIDARSRLAQIALRPKPPVKLGPPVEIVLSGGGYEGKVHVPDGYGGGIAALPIEPAPTRTVIGTACFFNRGHHTVLLDGTSETRTLSRSPTELQGKVAPGDIALTLLDNRPRSLFSQLGEVFGHASNLTDRLVPVWLIWVLAVIVAVAVPVCALGAFYLALREDEASGAL
jgi:hypothetical protein